jgi:hypothetical protein
MSRRKILPVGMQTINSKAFDDYRNIILSDFDSRKFRVFRRKFTQGAYWTSLDKDLANQYFRDEVWFLGIQIKDNLKFIDHGFETNDKGGVGFIKSK